MWAVSVEYLLGQISYDLIGDLGSLPVYNQTNKFGHVTCQLILVVK